jgi:hypothetical protein
MQLSFPNLRPLYYYSLYFLTTLERLETNLEMNKNIASLHLYIYTLKLKCKFLYDLQLSIRASHIIQVNSKERI